MKGLRRKHPLGPLGPLLVGLALASPAPAVAQRVVSQCIDVSSSISQCVGCRNSFEQEGNVMSDVNVSVNLGGGKTLGGCGIYGQSLRLIANAGASVRAVAVDGGKGPVPVRVSVSASVSAAPPKCQGGATIWVGNRTLSQNGPGEVSADWNLKLAPGQDVSASAQSVIECGGCDGRDPEGNYYGCQSEGQAVADPSFAIDPRWKHAASYRIEAYDRETAQWKPVPPPQLDYDGDGARQPDDCNDFNPDVNPQKPEIPDDGTDQDCNGGDRRALGLPPGIACADDSQCASGTCVEGICCDRRCGGGDAHDCQSCFQVLTGVANGTCAPLARGVVCRPASHACDEAEVCDGTHLDCAPDAEHLIGEVCRPSVDGEVCDPAERCQAVADGPGLIRSVCPADVRSQTPACLPAPVPASSRVHLVLGALAALALAARLRRWS